MITTDTLIGIIALCATFFSLGYSVGKNSKNDRPFGIG
jgi:hypothetical protein